MGIRDWLSGGKDVSAGWVRDPGLRLAFDFATGALNGVALGEPVERLAFLGPTGRKPKPGGDLEFLSLGLLIGVSDAKIDCYSLWWRDSLAMGYAPYAGSVLRQGEPVALGAATTQSEILSAFGPPYWRDQDALETILFYELKDRWGRWTERQVEIDERGRLEAMLVRTGPMLADEATRRSYGVDRPWPPV